MSITRCFQRIVSIFLNIASKGVVNTWSEYLTDSEGFVVRAQDFVFCIHLENPLCMQVC